MDKTLYMEREISKEFLSTQELKSIMKKYNFLDEYTPSIIHKASRGICKSLDKNLYIDYLEYKSTNYIHIPIKMKDAFEDKVKKNKQILESNKFITYESFCELLGFYPSKRVMNDRCEHYLVKNKMYYSTAILGISKDANENYIPIKAVVDLNLEGLQYTNTIIKFLENNSIKYIDSNKLLTKYSGYLIRKDDLEKIKKIRERENIIKNSSNRFEIYMIRCESFRNSIISKRKCLNTLIEFEKYIISRFKSNKKREELINAFVQITIFFDSYLEKELVEYSDKCIKDFIKFIDNEKRYTKLMKSEFIEFYNEYMEDKSCINSVFATDKKESKKIKPYSVETYIDFYALIFMKNNDKNFINKVVNDRSLAMAALYCALHYTCNWRASQIFNIYFPNIALIGFKTGDDLLKFLKDGNDFTEGMSTIICNDIKTKVDLYLTRVEKNNEMLFFQISRSMIHMIGFLLAVCEAHRSSIENSDKKGKSNIKQLITPTSQQKDYHIKVFGEEYNKIFHSEGFINRKGNKSYTTYIINKSQELGLGQGLLYAAITRGHVFNERLFSNQTFIYDDRYIDNSIYDIQLQLFERGTFGFAKDILLSIINDDYKTLNQQEKTEIINKLDMRPYEIEILMKGISKKKTNVNRIFKSVNLSKEKAKDILYTLISGDSYSKQENSNCLFRAFIKNDIDISEVLKDTNVNDINIKYPCIRQCGGCLGCDFLIGEIYVLNELNSKIVEIGNMIEGCKNEFEINMYYDIIYNGYRPILQEAINEFGPKMVKSFIDIDKVLKIAKTIKDKKLLGGVYGIS